MVTIKLTNSQAHSLLFGVQGFQRNIYKNWFPLPLFYPELDRI
jgi:hypothetical protein